MDIEEAEYERVEPSTGVAGKLETGVLALIGLARELDAELAAWNADVAEARRTLAGPLANRRPVAT